MKFTVYFCTNCNKCFATPKADTHVSELDKIGWDLIDTIHTKTENSLPRFTKKHATKKNWVLSDDQIVELRQLALKIINKYLPDFKLEDVEFEYDHLEG